MQGLGRILGQVDHTASVKQTVISSGAKTGIVVHWDGKLLPSLTGEESVERLSILISGKVVSSSVGHHILEIVLRDVFKAVHGSSSGPDVLLFQRFKKQWHQIKQLEFKTGETNGYITAVLKENSEWEQKVIDYYMKALKQTQPRDDYLRLTELCVIFLGGTPPRGIRFGKPGPVHHARWMSKALCSLQIFMFQPQFQLTIKDQTMALFVALVYGPMWFKAPEVFEAPSNDISFLKELHYYGEKIDESVGMAATKAFQRHLWYLSEESVALALFSDSVS
ncbi:hypothetical protein Hamer_G010306 [Homarus americanus]|uniref:Uncharacterized protein n=1 Tax=Homarus americanus TaxID=6706 RepID=A0A8J5JY49_HOMAM|nr:hypothetical protein Hamer_G010306 [Homarus americanus]